jgi:hypothetical protein
MVVPSSQGVHNPAAELADEIPQTLVQGWRKLSPVEREIIEILVTSWAADDARAGIGLAQPPARRSA